MTKKCIRCGDKNVVAYISGESYPLCNDCAKEWIAIIHVNSKKFDALKGKNLEDFWHSFWKKFVQREEVQFT